MNSELFKIIKKHFKSFFIKGLLIWIPVMITGWVLTTILTTGEKAVSQISTLFLTLSEQYQPLFYWVNQFHQYWLSHYFFGLGILIALLLVLFTGFIVNVFFSRKIGKWISHFSNWLLHKIPIVSHIYDQAKKISDIFLATENNTFQYTVLLPSPHSQGFVIGFVTGFAHEVIEQNLTNNINIEGINGLDSITEQEHQYLSVFIPLSPNPTNGHTIFINKHLVKRIDLNVQQALKYVIAMGQKNNDVKK